MSPGAGPCDDPAGPAPPAETPQRHDEAERLLAQLSMAEKWRLLSGGTPFWSGMAAIALADAPHRHPWPTGQLPRLDLRGLQFVDGPRGVVLRGGATTFPVPMARGASWNPELEERIGAAIAREARSFGADWLAAVCVNLLRHPGWGRAQETYGEDPLHVGALGAACSRGIGRHAIACVKHFALNSIDSSRFLVDVRASPRVLHELYLPQFRDCVEAGAATVMSAYNRVNGEWCGQHPQLLDAILKRRWGFEGFVVSDFIFGVRDGLAALRAGLDLEMPFPMLLAEPPPGLLEQEADGAAAASLASRKATPTGESGLGSKPGAKALAPPELDPRPKVHPDLPALRDRIDDAVRRQLRVQRQVPIGSYPRALRRCPEHLALAREAARQGIVLLRNEPAAVVGPDRDDPEAITGHRDGATPRREGSGSPVCGGPADAGPAGISPAGPAPLLPLGDLRSLAVIGPFADRVNLGDRGSSDTRPPPGAVVTPLQGLRAARPTLPIRHCSGEDPTEAAALAAGCEAAVVVAGLDWRLEGEHIHPGDIAPILRHLPPPEGLEALLRRPRLRPLWRRFSATLARLTRGVSARQGGDFAAGDRTDLRLPPDQLALIRAVAAANPRTVVVLMGGGAIRCADWETLVPALLLLWYPGEQGGHALAEVLFGQVSPSGRLPFSIPRDPAQLPPFEPRARRVTYDLWHGYRLLQRQEGRAAHPFGSGLSYSRFARTDPEARLAPAGNAVELAVSVSNLGAMAAAEVVQVYLEPPGLLMERPARSLVAFQRIALEPGEQRRLRLTIPLRRLACFEECRDGFVLEEGLHRLVVAAHAEDAGLAAELELEARDLGP